MKKEIEFSFEGVNYICSLEEENKDNINIDISEGEEPKFSGKISLKEVYKQISAFDEYTMAEFFAAAEDLTKDKIKLEKSSDKYELDLAFKVIKKEKHLKIPIAQITQSEDALIKQITKIISNNNKKLDQLEQELSEIKKELNIPDNEEEKKEIKEEDIKAANEWKEKGNAFVKEQKYKEALDCYTKAIICNPKEPILYSNRSAMYCNLEEYELSLKDAEKAMKLNPDYKKPYLRKGKALEKLNRKKEALEVYELGLQKDPNDAQLRQALNDLKYSHIS